MQITARIARASAHRLGATLLLAASAAATQAATVNGYTNAADWAASVNGYIQGWTAGETGNVDVTGMVIDFHPGIFGPPSPTPMRNGHYQVQADSTTCVNMGPFLSAPCQTYSAFTFATPVTAFSIDLDVLPGGIGDGVSFLVRLLDGSTVETGLYQHDGGSALAGTSHGFFGFTSDTPIALISLITNDVNQPLTAHEVADVNRFQFVYQQDTGGGNVPEPASFPLALLGLAATGALARQRRQSGAVEPG